MYSLPYIFLISDHFIMNALMYVYDLSLSISLSCTAHFPLPIIPFYILCCTFHILHHPILEVGLYIFYSILFHYISCALPQLFNIALFSMHYWLHYVHCTLNSLFSNNLIFVSCAEYSTWFHSIFYILYFASPHSLQCDAHSLFHALLVLVLYCIFHIPPHLILYIVMQIPYFTPFHSEIYLNISLSTVFYFAYCGLHCLFHIALFLHTILFCMQCCVYLCLRQTSERLISRICILN